MPQAVAAAVVAIKAVGAYVASASAAAAAGSATLAQTAALVAVKVGTALAASALAAALSPHVGANGNPTDWQANPDAPIPFAAGRIGVGGQIVHRDEYGPNNMYQTLVTILSGAGPIKSFVSFKGDDQAVTFTAEAATTSQWSGEMWMQTRRGLQPETAHTSPAGLTSGATLPNWGATYKLSGKASFMQTLSENSKRSAYPTGEPAPVWIIEGLYGYDPRLDSTYPGGSGTCRLNDPATWVYLTNPILWALKWSLGLWEGPTGKGAPQVDFQVGGIGAKPAGIEFSDFVEAANIADANGWTVAAYPTTDDNKAQVLDAFLQAGGAIYAERAGKIGCIHRAAARSSIVTITGDDTAGPIEYDGAASRIDRINTIRPRFWSEDNRWQMTAIDEATDASWRTEDGGTRTRGVDFPYVPNADQAKELALLQVANTREPITGVVPLKPYLQKIRPGDCFTITEPGFVLDGLKCLALTTEYSASESVHRVTFVSETDAKYTIALGATGTAPTPPTPAVVTPTVVTPPAGGEWTLTAGTVTGTDGAISPVLKLAGAVDNAAATSIIFEYRLNGATVWISAGTEGPEAVSKNIAGLAAGSWQAAVSYRVGSNTSTRLVLGPVTLASVVVPITPTIADGYNLLRRTGGGDYTGSLVANYTTNTNQLTDGANLGGTAAWTGVSSRPANIAALSGSEGINNASVTIGADGALSGAGGGTVTIRGVGYNGDLAATTGDNLVQNAQMTDGATGLDGYNPTTFTRTASVYANGDPGIWHLVNSTGSNANISQPSKTTGSATKYFGGFWFKAASIGQAAVLSVLGHRADGPSIGSIINYSTPVATDTNWHFYTAEGTVPAGSAFYSWSLVANAGCKVGGIRIGVTESAANITENRTALYFYNQGLLSVQNEVNANNSVAPDPGNGFIDYSFSSDYWTLGAGITKDTTTETTANTATTLAAPRSIKSLTGNGTTSQASIIALSIADATKYVRVVPGSIVDLTARSLYKSGYTGLVQVSVAFYKTTAGTGASTVTNVNFPDRRGTAQVGDAVHLISQRITVPSDAVTVKITIYNYWSTTLANAGYSLFAWPSIRRVTQWAVDLDGRPANVAALSGSEPILNTAIGITSSGALTGAGSGSVTIGGLGYTGALNANYTTNTNQLTDGANLGGTASWTGVSSRPANIASLAGSEPILNTAVTLSAAGVLTGGGTSAQVNLASLPGTVATAQIASGAVTATQLGTAAVDLASTKVTGKSLTNIDSAAATKLSGIATGATANTGALANLNTVGAAQINAGAVGSTQLATGAVDLAGTKVTGGGPLATSPLTEDKVQGRYLGAYAGLAAAVTAGLQNGDIWVDTSLVPAGLMAHKAGVSTEISTNGVSHTYAAQVDVSATSYTVYNSRAITGLSASSLVSVWFTMTIEASPTATNQSFSGTGAPAGDYQLVETGSGTDRIIRQGTWSSIPGGGVDTIVTLGIDGRNDNAVASSNVYGPIVVAAAGSRTYELRMRKTSGVKTLSKVGLDIFVQVQRNS